MNDLHEDTTPSGNDNKEIMSLRYTQPQVKDKYVVSLLAWEDNETEIRFLWLTLSILLEQY